MLSCVFALICCIPTVFSYLKAFLTKCGTSVHSSSSSSSPNLNTDTSTTKPILLSSVKSPIVYTPASRKPSHSPAVTAPSIHDIQSLSHPSPSPQQQPSSAAASSPFSFHTALDKYKTPVRGDNKSATGTLYCVLSYSSTYIDSHYPYILLYVGSKVGSATTHVTKGVISSALPEISLIIIDEVCSYTFIYTR